MSNSESIEFHDRCVRVDGKLRDQFAGQALIGLLFVRGHYGPPSELAVWAYRIADAMVVARLKYMPAEFTVTIESKEQE